MWARRCYSSAAVAGRPVNFKVFNPYIPPKYPTSWMQVKDWGTNTVKSLMSLYKLKQLDKSWSKTDFVQEITLKYKLMHESLIIKLIAFRGKPGRLYSIMTAGAIEKLLQDFGNLDKLKGLEWAMKGISTKIVNYAIIEVETGKEKEKVAQITVSIDSTQSIAVPTEGEPVSEDTEREYRKVKEYIVVEKWISDPEDAWKIAAKVNAN